MGPVSSSIRTDGSMCRERHGARHAARRRIDRQLKLAARCAGVMFFGSQLYNAAYPSHSGSTVPVLSAPPEAAGCAKSLSNEVHTAFTPGLASCASLSRNVRVMIWSLLLLRVRHPCAPTCAALGVVEVHESPNK